MEPLAILMVVQAERERYEELSGYRSARGRRFPEDLPVRKPAGRLRRWSALFRRSTGTARRAARTAAPSRQA